MQAPPLPPSLDHPRLKVLAVGNSGCGKSCLIKRYCEGRFVSKYIPTIGIDYGVKKVAVNPSVVAQHRAKLQASGQLSIGESDLAVQAVSAVRVNFWDVAGGEEAFLVRNEFYSPAQGILLVYDVRNAESFQALDKWLEEIHTYTNAGDAGNHGANTNRRPSVTTTSNTPAGRVVGDLQDGKAPILYVLANKVDDVSTVQGESTRRVVSEAEGRRWAESHGCAAYYETSASSDLNVPAAMEAMFYDVMAKFMFAAEYVSAHLHGLAVIADISGAAAAAANSPSPALAAGNVIATHNGSFHCDEALACGLLRHTDLYRHAIVLRTRDPAQIDQCAIVVDVGAVYDPSRNRYDHHQSSFQETMTTDSRTYKTRLSSAGLVYKHFGKEIIESFLRQALADATVRALSRLPTEQEGYSPNDINAVFDVVYKHFVEQVDGIDNGVDQFSLPDGGEGFDGKALVRNYIQSTTLSHRVGSIQAWWNEADRCNNTVIENALFAEAVEMASREFFEAVTYFAFSWLPARAIVEDALDHAKEVHPSGRILVLKEFCPWKEHLLEIEVERGCAGHALYVVFADGKGGSWRVQAVPKESVGFASRRPLPFAGLRDDALSAASGIDGGVFVHVSGFIGGMKTYEGALALAAKALEAE